MNRYESYKPSNIDWVGEIPSHWETIQPKYKLNRVTRPIDDEDEVITCFRDGVVTLRKNRREDGFTNSIKEHGYQQIHPGDLVVHEMDGFAGAIGISDSKGKSTPVYTVIEPDHRTDVRYISYLLREMSQTGKIESLARSIRERTTDFRWNMWSVVHFPFPNVEEQKLISRYLDKKTSQIDSLVEKIQKKIELVKEQRTSLINHFVTKGLNSNVEMKDSGVEWIGEIPKHWEITKIKYLVGKDGFRSGPFGSTLITSQLSSIGDWIVYSPENLRSKNIDNQLYVPNERKDELSKYLVKEGDILLPIVGSLNVSKVIDEKDPIGIINQRLCRLSLDPDKVNVQMISFMFKYSNLIQTQIELEKKGSILDHITKEIIFNFTLPLSPIPEERDKLYNKLTDVYDKLELLISKHQTKILHLKEYRQSLISSVVTGKVRVTEDMI